MTNKAASTGAVDPDVLLLIGRMDGKLDIILTRHDQHERRLSALEAWKNRAVGWLAAVAAAAGATAGAGGAHLGALIDLLK